MRMPLPPPPSTALIITGYLEGGGHGALVCQRSTLHHHHHRNVGLPWAGNQRSTHPMLSASRCSVSMLWSSPW